MKLNGQLSISTLSKRNFHISYPSIAFTSYIFIVLYNKLVEAKKNQDDYIFIYYDSWKSTLPWGAQIKRVHEMWKKKLKVHKVQ